MLRVNQVDSGLFVRCNNKVPSAVPTNCATVPKLAPLALISAKFPRFAKCAVMVVPTAFAMTPHSALATPEKHRRGRRYGKRRGMRQSERRARSYDRSAMNRYFWGSVERDEEARQAKRIVARRPVESCITVRRTTSCQFLCGCGCGFVFAGVLTCACCGRGGVSYSYAYRSASL